MDAAKTGPIEDEGIVFVVTGLQLLLELHTIRKGGERNMFLSRAISVHWSRARMVAPP